MVKGFPEIFDIFFISILGHSLFDFTGIHSNFERLTSKFRQVINADEDFEQLESYDFRYFIGIQ